MTELKFLQIKRFLVTGILISPILIAFAGNYNLQGQELPGLLKKFRSEFIKIQPGSKQHPAAIQVLHPKTQKKIEFRFKQNFEINKFEVTQDLWKEVMGENPSRWKGPRNSVEELDYPQAVEFCHRITKLLRKEKLIGANELIRLPSETEWEYVAAAGTKTRYSFGDDMKDLDEYGWFTGNAAGNDPPVGAKKPNPWGLYDVHGYLWEWCIDSYSKDSVKTIPTGTDWARDTKPILRSGSWKDPAKQLETRFRRTVAKTLKDDAVGLRCLLAKLQAR